MAKCDCGNDLKVMTYLAESSENSISFYFCDSCPQMWDLQKVEGDYYLLSGLGIFTASQTERIRRAMEKATTSEKEKKSDAVGRGD